MQRGKPTAQDAIRHDAAYRCDHTDGNPLLGFALIYVVGMLTFFGIFQLVAVLFGV